MNEYLFMLTEIDIASKAFYKSITLLPESYLGKNLFGEFPGVPAIICGEGYSLSKELPMIKSLENQAIVFASGGAVHLLNRNGIIPHFGVASDPSQVQEVRFLTHFSYEVPFFFSTRFCPEAAEKIHGPRLFLADLSEKDMARWFYEALGLPVFQESLTNTKELYLSAVLACLMKCNPVIFIGIDDIPKAEHAAAIQDLHEKYPDTQLIDTANSYSKCSYDLKNWIHAKIEQSQVILSTEVSEVLGLWSVSLERCEGAISHLLEELNSLREQGLSETISTLPQNSEKKGIWEANLNQEIAYKNLLVRYHDKFVNLPKKELIKLSHFPEELEGNRHYLSVLNQEIERYELLKVFLGIHKRNCSESLQNLKKGLNSCKRQGL